MSYTGTVLSYSGRKCFGFIQCEQLPQGDVFFGKNALPPELVNAGDFADLKGKTLQFELSPQDYNGKPVASQVQLLPGEGLGYDPAMQQGDSTIGVVKSYNPQKGYGFIGVEGQSDFWFNKRDLPAGCQEMNLSGQSFSFNMVMSPDGKQQAKNLQPQGPMPGAMQGGFAQQAFGQPQPFFSSGFQQTGQQMYMQAQRVPAARAPQGGMPPVFNSRPQFQRPGMQMQMGPQAMGFAPGTGAQMQGVVKTFDASKGFGFAACDGYAEDLYFKGQGVDFAPGETITFWVKVMPDGKCQARSVQKSKTCTDGAYRATVTSYNPKNGYGFLTILDPAGAPDVYFKKDHIPPEFQEADIKGVEFDIVIQHTPDGKPQCRQMSISSGDATGADVQPAKRSRLNTGLASGGADMGGAKAEREMTEAQGVVTSYSPGKGFGFITSPACQEDVFFSKKLLPVEWAEQPLQGMKVAFMLSFTADGKPQGQGLRMAC